jgi:hypothetical protein
MPPEEIIAVIAYHSCGGVKQATDGFDRQYWKIGALASPLFGGNLSTIHRRLSLDKVS